MKKTRLWALLQTLSNREIAELRLFLQSPFFNRREEVTLLFEYLCECLTQLKVTPSKEDVYRRLVSRSSPYNDQQLRHWMSYLVKLIEQYWVQAALFKDPIQARTLLVGEYRKRGLTKPLDQKIKQLQVALEQQPHRHADFYAADFQVQLEQYRFSSAHRRMSELNLQQLSDTLDIAFVARKLRFACLAVSHQTVYKTEYDLGLIPSLLEHVEGKQLHRIPAIGAYYFGFLTLTEPNQGMYFVQFKQTITDHGDKFPQEELGDLYLLAINFCIKRYNEGDHQYVKDEFELYRQGLAKKLFLKNNTLSRFSYRNIVTVGLVMEEFDWVENFIHEYRPHLDPGYRASMFSFSLARLEYSRKNYKEALHLLQKSDYKDLLLNLAAKTVMLKIFYELDEYDLLDAHLKAMYTFIRRKKIIGYHQTNYLNLIQFVRKLMEHNPYDRKATQSIRRQLEQTKAVAEKGWLLEQV
jgi:hypothetical protein